MWPKSGHANHAEWGWAFYGRWTPGSFCLANSVLLRLQITSFETLASLSNSMAPTSDIPQIP